MAHLGFLYHRQVKKCGGEDDKCLWGGEGKEAYGPPPLSHFLAFSPVHLARFTLCESKKSLRYYCSSVSLSHMLFILFHFALSLLVTV